MHAMILKKLKTPLEWIELPDRDPGPHEIRVKVLACGVCRTDLHVVDGELPCPKIPIIPGHEIVGRIDSIGAGVQGLAVGERVGIPWLGHTDGTCPYCLMHRENLCDHPLFTGYTRDGGYATTAVADARFAFPLGEAGSDISIAPLLCAGLIGWRSLVIAGEAKRIGLYGFGAAAHILAQVTRWQGRCVYAFTRAGDARTQHSPRAWARSGRAAPMRRPRTARRRDHLRADRGLGPGGAQSRAQGGQGGMRGIHMSDIPSFPYSILWEERGILSVANLTRKDGLDFLRSRRRSESGEDDALRAERANQALEDCGTENSRAPPS